MLLCGGEDALLGGPGKGVRKRSIVRMHQAPSVSAFSWGGTGTPWADRRTDRCAQPRRSPRPRSTRRKARGPAPWFFFVAFVFFVVKRSAAVVQQQLVFRSGLDPQQPRYTDACRFWLKHQTRRCGEHAEWAEH